MIESKRLFLALKIQPDQFFLKELIRLKRSLHHEQIKWINTENMHLTLRFFGETSIDQIQDLKDAISKALKEQSSFGLEIENLGIFGSHYQPKVIWLGIREPDLLKHIESRLNKDLELIGFARDRQNFVPHLSIARIKKLKDKAIFRNVIEDFKEVFYQKSEVKELILYESILHQKGAEYKIIKKFDLKA